jgi:hypothetical protein
MIRNMMLMKVLSVFMAVALLAWTSQDAFSSPPPQSSTNVTFNARVTVKAVKTGPHAIKPIAIYVNGKRFPVVNKNGQWGIQTTYKNLMTAAPQFKQELDKKIGESLGGRLKELAASGKSGIQAGKSANENKQRVATEANQLKGQFASAYANMQQTTLAAFPRFDNRLTGAAEGAKEAGESTGDNGAAGGEVGEEAGGGTGEGSESDPVGSVLLFLGALALVVTAFIVPVLAVAWLASTALTLASFTAAVTGTVLLAGAGVVFNSAMKNLATGEPMWSSYYIESFSGSPGAQGGS